MDGDAVYSILKMHAPEDFPSGPPLPRRPHQAVFKAVCHASQGHGQGRRQREPVHGSSPSPTQLVREVNVNLDTSEH